VFSVTVFTALFGNLANSGRSFVPSGWRPFYTNFLLFYLPSQDPLVMAACPLYTASAQTAQKTPLPTTLLLLRACLFWRSCDGYWAIAWQRACLQSRTLATSVSAGFAILTFSRYATLVFIMNFLLNLILWNIFIWNNNVKQQCSQSITQINSDGRPHVVLDLKVYCGEMIRFTQRGECRRSILE
jgi:hypothetical protein